MCKTVDKVASTSLRLLGVLICTPSSPRLVSDTFSAVLGIVVKAPSTSLWLLGVLKFIITNVQEG